MIKAAFFDIDGTLFSHTIHQIPDSARAAIHQLREKGIKVFIATGRGLKALKGIPWGDLKFDGYITLNGQICLDAEENVLFEAPIKGQDGEYLLNAFKNKTIPLAIVEKDRYYLNFFNDTVKKAQESVAIPMLPIDEYSGKPVYQFIAYMNRTETEAFAKNIPNCKITRWYEEGIDIISKDGGKANGIEKVIEFYGFTREEMIAFGDSDNDLEMLEYAGIGVAMGNAVECVKEAADYVTAHVDEDGVMKALQHFGIL